MVRLESLLSTISQEKYKDFLSGMSILLLYPREGYKLALEQCWNALDEEHLCTSFLEFRNYAKEMELDDLQIAYTELFDLNFHISLYAGYHLFGESYLRSMFLVGLSSRFAKIGFESKEELHDHIGVLVRFLAEYPETQLASELIEDAVLPMLNRIIWSKTRPEDKPGQIKPTMAYYALLRTLLLYLSGSESGEEEVVCLPVQETVIEENIDRWIKGGNKSETKQRRYHDGI